MKTRLALAAALTLTACASGPRVDLPPATAHHNVGRDLLALEGYDPVSYFPDGGGRPQPGSPELTAEWDGLTYRFADPAHREQFIAEPAAFLPAYGGWCAWAMADAERVAIDPESFLIEDGRLLLFYDGIWGDTRAMWLEVDGADTMRPRADEAWAAFTR